MDSGDRTILTYENVVSWCEKNKPQEEYDTFAEWYDACYEAVNTPNLFDNPDFNRMLEDSWLNEFGNFDRQEISSTSGVTEIDTSREPQQDKTFSATSAIIHANQTPIKVQSKSPIRFTPIKEEIRLIPKTGQAPIIKPLLVAPPNTDKNIISRIFNSIFKVLKFGQK